MKSSEYILEVLQSMDPETTNTHKDLLEDFTKEYDEEIRFKILEFWGEYLRETKKP